MLVCHISSEGELDPVLSGILVLRAHRYCNPNIFWNSAGQRQHHFQVVKGKPHVRTFLALLGLNPTLPQHCRLFGPKAAHNKP